MRKVVVVSGLIIALSFIFAAYLYPMMPGTMASHWDAQGNVNGHMPKALALFLLPVLTGVIFVVFLIIPAIDPLKENIKGFRGYYDNFILLFVVFMGYLYALTVAWNFGYKFNFMLLLSPAFAALFYYVGVVTEHARPNWFIGVRTPWTLSSESVWKKTHALAGKLFKWAGIVALLGLVTGGYAIFFTVGPAVLFSLYLVLYSFLEFQKEEREKPGPKKKRKK